MRRIRNWAAALAFTCLAAHAAAGDLEVRERIQADVRAAFAAGRYQEIEDRYAAALAQSAHTPSGYFVADVIRKGIVQGPKDESSVPGRDDYWIPLEQKLEDWAAKFPQSSLVAIVQAHTYLDHGWSWRGDGYARTVTPEGFKKLGIYSGRAYDALMAREQVGRKDPNWYAQMLTLSRIQDWDGDRWFGLVREATEAFPLYYNIYFAVATRLTPRWGGSPQALASLAAFAVDQTRKVEGEAMYARIYWELIDYLDADPAGPDVDWKRIRAGFEDLLKRYPDNLNLNRYARFACEARDMPTAQRLLLRIKGDVDPTAWRDRASYLRCAQAAGLKRDQLQ